MFLQTGEKFGISAKVVTFKDTERFDLRLYSWRGGEWRPTKVGIVIPLDRLDDFIEGVKEVRDGYYRGDE